MAIDGQHHAAYVTSASNDRLYTLSLDSGAVLNTTMVGANPIGLAVDTSVNKVLVVASAQPRVDIVDGHSGQLVDTIALPRMRYAVVPVIDSNLHRAYVAEPAAFLPHRDRATPGSVQMLDLRTGRLIGKVEVGIDPVAMAVDPMRHLIVVASRGNAGAVGGTISEFDSRTGKTMRTIPLPGHPSGLVLDAQAATIAVTLRAMITSNNSLTQSQLDTAGQLVLVAE
jgi:DNA-binding beta-propeller fold protein YncE